LTRDRANIRTDLWADSHWRSLTPGAQWLYLYLLSAPSLSYVGIADWRPVRIAKLGRGLSKDSVERYADELAGGRFVVVSDETEEILIRSFLRHDGLLKNPNLWKSVGLDFAAVAAPELRTAIAEETLRLRAENPHGFVSAKGGSLIDPWSSTHLRTLLGTATHTPMPTPSDTPSRTPSLVGSGTGSPTATATSTSTEASLPGDATKPKGRSTRISKDWAPTAAHIERARERHLDLVGESEAFRLHAETHDRHAVNWNAAFTTWLNKAKPAPVTTSTAPRVGGPGGMSIEDFRREQEERAEALLRRGVAS
jgi:hypothetical protein